MSDSPSAKRKRTDDSEVDIKPQPARSEIWYNDGSVVIQTDFTQFRVHQTILSAHSPVLKEMCLEDQKPNNVEGCPVLHLLDSTEEITHLLKALYDQTYYRPSDRQPLAKIGAILRLAKKYQITYLHDDAVSRLSTEFPSTLGAWDNFHFQHVGKRIIFPEPHISCFIDVINLARETGIHSILPTAYLGAVLCGTRFILEGVHRNLTLTVLSHSDQKLCILGKDALHTAQANHMFAWLNQKTACPHPRRCNGVRNQYIIRLWKSPSPPHDLGKWGVTGVKGLCRKCMEIGRNAYEAGRQRVWDRLPSFFGLPDWAELLS